MAQFLAALCDSDPSNPFPLWENGTVGYCFTQLVLNVVPHAALAFASACYLNTPRSRWQNFTWSWESRIIISFVMLALFLIDVVTIIFFPNLTTLWLEVLVDSVSVIAWLVHGLAMIALSRSQYGRSLGPTVLMIFAVLPAPAFIIILVADCQTGQITCSEYLSSWLRFILISAELSLLIAYIVVLVASHSRRDEQGSEREPLLQGQSIGPEEQIAAEEGTSWVSRLFYCWMNPLLKQGYNRQITQPDHVYQLPPKLRTQTIEELFQKCLQICKLREASKKGGKQAEQKSKPAKSRRPRRNSWRDRRASAESQEETPQANQDIEVSAVLHKAFGFRYYSLGILKFIGNMLGFAGPLLLNQLVNFMESGSKQINKGIWYTLGLFLSTFAGAIILNQFNYHVMMIGMSVRSAIISAIYRKTLRVNATCLSKFSVGEIVNFMSTDTDRIVNFFPSFHEVWSLPFQFSITLYLLHQQVGVAFLGGLILGLLLIPINKIIASIIMENSKKMLGHKDSRVMLMTEILFGIRVIKFYTWEDHFMAKIDNYRKQELHHLKIIKYLDAVCVYMWAALPVVISIVTFVTYVLMGQQLTAAKVFTTLALVGMLIMPLNNFPWVLNGIIQAKVSLDRIQHFLIFSDQDLTSYYTADPSEDSNSAIELHDASFDWRPCKTSDEPSNEEAEHDGSMVLLNLNLILRKGQLIGIVGKVGSGKSSLLAAITGELNRLDGEVYISTLEEGFGLAAQESWIQFATIRENILFGNPFDAQRYQEVIEICALSEDLEVLPNGDQTSVGESGVTLSGGQKARVALARAVYMDKDVYLLDDPLAAVDADVANHLMKNCILGFLKNKTVILCTHRTEFLDEADMIVMMENGQIIKIGTPDEVLKKAEDNHKPRKNSQKIAAAKEEQIEVEEEKKETNELMEVELEAKQEQNEEKKAGTVALHVYRTYWMSIGKLLACLVLLSILLMQATRNLSDWWLSHWISHLEHKNGSTSSSNSQMDPTLHLRFIRSSYKTHLSPDVKFYLIVFGAIAVANTAFTAIRAFLFASGAIRAAVVVHKKLLCRTMQATLCFFDTTPIGRIVNRFSSDLYSVDDTLPFILNIFLATLFGLLGMVLMISYSLPWIMLVLMPLAIGYFYLQRYYRFTSRELKRFTAITLSPIYTQFSETLKGLTTIRASRAVPRFEKENNHRLELNQRCLYAANTAMQWLDIRLQMVGVTVVTSIALIAVIEHSLSRGNPGLVGLALSYALSVTSLLSGVISSFTQTETQMVSVERLDEYTTEIPTEVQDANFEVSPMWQHGMILFQDVVLVYRPGLPTVLNGINIKINPGEKIGIVGRTGSGKSSLFLALFRMVELTEGQIFIDNVNTRTIKLSDLRSNMAIIPQDPFLFSGSVRENLDPLNHHTDHELHTVLHQCHLLEVTRRMGGLTAELGERGKKLSIGQKQLMCLARALLTKSKILCIDEATASVDQKTDQLLQETIRRQFAEKTVLTIAHRINTIMDSNRVLVMDAGTVKEFDSPDVLSQDKESHFYHFIHGDELE